MKVIFFGSADFGIPTLKILHDHHTVVAVVTTPPRPQGRGRKLAPSPIATFASEHTISPIITPESLKSEPLVEELQQCKADIFIVVAYRILPKAVFSIPPKGTINIHASLLPKFRGPAPIQRAIESGETESGITIFHIDEGIDTGNILLKETVPIGPKETTPELYDRLSTLGADALGDILVRLEHGTIEPIPQDNRNATRAPKLSKDEAEIDWGLSAEAIFNKIRAFKPFPGTYTFKNSMRLGIEWAEPLNEQGSGEPGTIVAVSTDTFDVQCGSGILRIFSVKPEGKKEMSVASYKRGTPINEGIKLG